MQYNLVHKEKYSIILMINILWFPLGVSLKSWQIIYLLKQINKKKDLYRSQTNSYLATQQVFLFSSQILLQ